MFIGTTAIAAMAAVAGSDSLFLEEFQRPPEPIHVPIRRVRGELVRPHLSHVRTASASVREPGELRLAGREDPRRAEHSLFPNGSRRKVGMGEQGDDNLQRTLTNSDGRTACCRRRTKRMFATLRVAAG